MPTKPKTRPAKPKSKPAPVEGRAPAPPGPVPTQVDGAVTLAQIRPSPLNPRKSFPPESIESLAASIGEQGLLQRLLVRPVGVDGATPAFARGKWTDLSHYELVDGERRYRALLARHEAGTLASDLVQVTLRWLSDAEALAVMIVANEEREDVRPSEQAAGYAALHAALGSNDAVAAAVGKPVSYVRKLLSLSKLPTWALAAVDAGALPRATAELVARVPSEESRKKCAACVLLGTGTECYADDWVRDDYWKTPYGGDPLSYRDTKDLIRNHFTVELKGAPFDRKALELVPEAGSCEACPKRAGNDEEAIAEGTRADVCLDPDCYRAKATAHDARVLVKGTRKGWLDVPEEFDWPHFMASPPKGWCDIDAPAQLGDLSNDFAGSKKGEKKLGELLGLDNRSPGNGPLVFAAIDPKHKLRGLIKTADARKALQDAGVLKKPERAPSAGRTVPPVASASGTPAGPTDHEVGVRALVTAAKVLGAYGEEQFAELNDVEDACANGPVVQMLRLVTRAVAYEWLVQGGAERIAVLRLRFPEINGGYARQKSDGDCLNDVVNWTAAKCLAFLAQLVAAVELEHGANTDTAEELLAFAELDWQELQEQARRELAGPKVAKAEAAPTCSAVGKCRLCGCVESNCAGCIARTGRPCSWTSPKQDLCTACLPLIESDIGVLFVGAHGIADGGAVTKLGAAGVRTIGHVLALDPKKPPKGLSAEKVEDLKAAAEKRIDIELGRDTKPAGKRPTPGQQIAEMVHVRDESGALVTGAEFLAAKKAKVKGAKVETGPPEPATKPVVSATTGPVRETPPETSPPADTPLASVKDFPAKAVEQLARKRVHTAEDLDAELAAYRKRKNLPGALVYDVLRELSVPGEVVFEAGDAMIARDMEQTRAKEAEAAKSAAKSKGKTKPQGAKR